MQGYIFHPCIILADMRQKNHARILASERVEGHTIYGNRSRIHMKPRIWTDNITNETISESV